MRTLTVKPLKTPAIGTGTTAPRLLTPLLPSKDDPDYLWILCEMIRADLEFTWAERRPRRLKDYRDEFPELFSNQAVLRALASEEYQIRESHGDRPSALEYAQEYGMEMAEGDSPSPRMGSGVMAATVAYSIRALPPEPSFASQSVHHRLATNSSYQLPLPNVPTPFPETSTGQFPGLNQNIMGFHILEELGRGSFARVYLAKQAALADRVVAVKVTTRPTYEADRLAKLQHTNIVPIYSVHSHGTLQAICMPFLGRYTLADTLDAIRKQGLPQRSGSELFSTIADAVTVPDHPLDTPTNPKATPAPIQIPDPRKVAAPQPVRDMLNAMPYLDAVAWVIARLAEGLEHAHKRGIRHHDIKPANVLLSDDGQPMLLDFNLAHDVANGRREQLGGTIMYMAPEQLDEVLQNKPGLVDERTDLYSLGVIFFELLTSHHPFPIPAKCDKKFQQALALRQAGPSRVRDHNPMVPQSFEAIVQKLLQNDPRKRYQSAEQLRTDLDRHAHHLPLLFVQETSLRERVHKWRKRNPHAVRKIALMATATFAIGVGVWGYEANQAYHTRVATDTVHTLHNDLTSLRVDLAAAPDSSDLVEGLTKAKEWLTMFAVNGSDPTTHTTLRKLTPADRAQVLTDLGELSALVALVDSSEADKWQAQSEFFISNAVLLNDKQASEWAVRKSYLSAIQAHRDGKVGESIKTLETLVQDQPEHYGAQFLLAMGRADLQQSERAVERIEIARSLAPRDHRPAMNAGKVYLAIKRFKDAEGAFTKAIEYAPTSPEAYILRAKARSQMQQYQEAMKDLDAAAALGGTPPTLLALRYNVNSRLGKMDLADKDREALIAFPAKTAYEYCLKGFALAKDHPEAALEAFQQATTLNPHYTEAWHNQGYVYTERLKQPEKGIEVLGKAIAAGPYFTESRMGRAVLFARLGKRQEAHQDAEAGLLLPLTPRLKFQAACVYALTSSDNPQDADRAYALLREAIREGFNSVKAMEEDEDLINLRSQETFKSLLRGMKEIVR